MNREDSFDRPPGFTLAVFGVYFIPGGGTFWHHCSIAFIPSLPEFSCWGRSAAVPPPVIDCNVRKRFNARSASSKPVSGCACIPYLSGSLLCHEAFTVKGWCDFCINYAQADQCAQCRLVIFFNTLKDSVNRSNRNDSAAERKIPREVLCWQVFYSGGNRVITTRAFVLTAHAQSTKVGFALDQGTECLVYHISRITVVLRESITPEGPSQHSRSIHFYMAGILLKRVVEVIGRHGLTLFILSAYSRNSTESPRFSVAIVITGKIWMFLRLYPRPGKSGGLRELSTTSPRDRSLCFHLRPNLYDRHSIAAKTSSVTDSVTCHTQIIKPESRLSIS